MKVIYGITIPLFILFSFFPINRGGVMGMENQPPGSPDQGAATPPGRSYLDIERGEYPGLIPLTSYSSEKAKTLAKKYRKELIEVIKLLSKEYPGDQLDIQGVGFLKSPKSGKNDARYLSVIMEVAKEYEKEKTSFEKRIDDIFQRYIDPIAMMLFKYETILKDPRVEGIAVCPNWMVGQSQKMSGYTTMSEGMFVSINKTTGRAIVQGKVPPSHLRKEARIYGRQGDRVFAVAESGNGGKQ